MKPDDLDGRWVRFPKRRMWHRAGHRWSYAAFTDCDRRIPDGPELSNERPHDEDVCWNCLTGQRWQKRVPAERVLFPLDPPPSAPTGATADGAGASMPLATTRRRPCAHLWVAAALDPTFEHCPLCRALRRRKGAA